MSTESEVRLHPTTTSRKRILHVEDHKSAARLIATILKNFLVISVHTHAEACRIANSEKFDLFILDQDLPDGTGIEICLFIRSFDQKTPIIFLTGNDSMTELHVSAIGAQGLIKKGGNFLDQLRATVEKVIPA